MKKNIYVTILLVTIVIVCKSCISTKDNLVQFDLVQPNNEKDVSIYKAILDYSRTNKDFENYTVFSVSFQDTVCRMSLIKMGNNIYEWLCNDFYENLIAVGIRPSSRKFTIIKNSNLELYKNLPNKHVEISGKLFYWHDNDIPVTKDILDTYRKHKILVEISDSVNNIVPDFITNDSQKAAHYYFCKYNLSYYKKVITNKAIGYYEVPKLKKCK